ncbi:MAG TPA: GAF domain-containing protein [Stellaceae bacterium]|nr:GAF domain-containing protein [Stellaceae bacterium]
MELPRDTQALLNRLRDYRAAVLEFALAAFGETDRQSLLQRVTECVSRCLAVERTKILRARPDDLLIIAGVGWKPGVVGTATLPHGMRSPPGRTVATGEPVMIGNLPGAEDFDHSDLLRDHGIRALINVPIKSSDEIWGVLDVDSTALRRFDQDDEDFLCDFARLLGRTIELTLRAEISQAIERRLRIEVSERAVLFAELRHRIANQLHIAMGTLEVARRRIADPQAKTQLERVVDRIASMVATNEQLSLSQVESEISLGADLARLSESIKPPERIEIRHAIADAAVQLRVAVRLGFIVNELVTNAIKYAFDGGAGKVYITFANAAGEGRKGSSGTGLVNSLADQIGARVEVTTAASGTTVTVRFPLPALGAAQEGG